MQEVTKVLAAAIAPHFFGLDKDRLKGFNKGEMAISVVTVETGLIVKTPDGKVEHHLEWRGIQHIENMEPILVNLKPSQRDKRYVVIASEANEPEMEFVHTTDFVPGKTQKKSRGRTPSRELNDVQW